MNVLYLTYDGLTDPLGQSQIITYLNGLQLQGHSIHIISFEKHIAFKKYGNAIQSQLLRTGITWTPLTYTKNPPVLSTLIDLQRLINASEKYIKANSVQLIHCRSYITSLIGLKLKRKFSIPFLFDMRGLWADERIDGHIWNLKNPLYKMIYSFFKKKELAFLKESDAIISLTHAAKIELDRINAGSTKKTFVIPCCVDTDLFNTSKINQSDVEKWKVQLSLNDQNKYLVYVGSIGTWYLLKEMLLFFKALHKQASEYRFLFITTEDSKMIFNEADRLGIAHQLLLITSSGRSELPALLHLCHFSIFFIKPAYSKIASSPTKQAELLSMGIPVVCNDGIGDSSIIVERFRSGIVLKNLTENDFDTGVNELLNYKSVAVHEMHLHAENEFSLSKGVLLYNQVYSFIAKGGHS